MLLMGKSTISMAIFNCYVSSPEGIYPTLPYLPYDLGLFKVIFFIFPMGNPPWLGNL